MSTGQCRAYVLAEVLAVLDGVTTEAGEMTCAEQADCAVFIRRPGWQLHVAVCDAHRVVISLGVVGYVRST